MASPGCWNGCGNLEPMDHNTSCDVFGPYCHECCGCGCGGYEGDDSDGPLSREAARRT